MNIQVVNTETIPGKEITEVLGLVRGSTIRAKWIGKDIMAGLRNIVGGEMTEYTEMLAETREQALKRMLEDAERLGANAVVNVRFTTSMVAAGAAEMLAYGTAVTIR
ncbi:MAG: YbjQ family protein [Candidatus Undinarchaeales archaeon]|nr:YbjQ family protein [Candidatus Undinarchaeales archaeon]MDP7492791.1 YbjQ family protein [Candidatus Undinarchaeales archaeon]